MWARITLSLGIFLASSTTPVLANPSQQVQEVVSYLVGVLDTSAQAAANTDKANVQMTTCTVGLETGVNSVVLLPAQVVFLYQEQVLAGRPEQPYRQRILRIAPHPESESIESKSYKLSDPQKLIGFCQQPQQERKVAIGELLDAECSVFLKPEDNGYVGKTPPEGCPTNFRGATKITNLIILNAEGMTTWDRGFDAENNQVWGAEEEPFRFLRSTGGP